MAPPLFIAGDWGTSNMRLFLIDDGQVRDRVTGPGIGQSVDGPAAAFAAVTTPWRERYGRLPVLLCGTVGSSIGWVETPYSPCPAGYGELDAMLTRFQAGGHSIAIVPGLTAQNPLGAADFMRGEETQIFGALESQPGLAHGTHFLCLPGTHSKWVLLRDGRIETFLTALSGELFAVLRQHSVLCRGAEGLDPINADAFTTGVARARTSNGALLLHQLFETRGRQLTGGLSKPEAVSFLSGLIIGHDVAGALAAFRALLPEKPVVTVIGSTTLLALYDAALRAFELDAVLLDGMAQSLTGLGGIARSVDIGESTNA